MAGTVILIADTNSIFNQTTKAYLGERGFDVHTTEDGNEAYRLILTLKPKIAFLDLLLPRMNALQILQQLKADSHDLSHDLGGTTRVLIGSTSANVNNIRECLKLGAADYLIKPLETDDFVPRLVFHLQEQHQVRDVPTTDQKDGSNLYLYLVELILRQAHQSKNLPDLFAKLTQMSAMALKSVRASIVRVDAERGGTVLSSSDAAKGSTFNLNLRKYPEVVYAMNTGKTVAIDSISTDPMLASIKAAFNQVQFNAIIIAPIFVNAPEPWGVLAIRLPADRARMLDEEIRFAQVIAHVAGLGIRLYKT